MDDHFEPTAATPPLEGPPETTPPHAKSHTFERRIAHLLTQRTSRNVNVEHDQTLTFGERMADRLAEWAGSWIFIYAFGVVLATWMALNSIALIHHWDPYPFILLNLVLSCIAAIQAPVIMMSQNRQEARDRIRADNDYLVNVKAERLLEHLTHEVAEIKATTKALADRIGASES